MLKFLVTFAVSIIALSVQAKEVVTINYAFSPADSMANYTRILVDEANKQQDKYTFVFDTKPGAGGAIAINWLKSNSTNGIVMHSSAFFIRPNFFPNESWDVAEYKELMPECLGPIAITSVKYKSLNDIPANTPLTIGTSGLGVTTHLVALQLMSKYPNLKIVPFKSTTDSLLSMVSGTIDLSVNFLSEPEQWGKDGSKVRVNILGITGDKVIHGHPTLASEGFPKKLESLSAPHHLVVSVKVPDDKFKEWRAILVKASTSKAVQATYAIDSCQPLNTTSDADLQPWYNMQNSRWKELTQGVKIN